MRDKIPGVFAKNYFRIYREKYDNCHAFRTILSQFRNFVSHNNAACTVLIVIFNGSRQQ